MHVHRTFTPLWEQQHIGAAKRGDRVAEAQLLDLYEPMVRRITGSLYLPGGEREDLAQEARLGILAAIRTWDPDRSVPFRCFAWLCAVREARMAVSAARAAKHQPLNRARSLQSPIAEDGVPLQDTLVASWCSCRRSSSSVGSRLTRATWSSRPPE